MISLTVILIIITIALSVAAFGNAELLSRLMMNPYKVFKGKQFYRLITSGFVHLNWVHLGFNMFTFYFFGKTVEYLFGRLLGPLGSWVFILFYLTAIVVSDLPVAYKHRNHPGYNSLGASGGVSAVLFASILYNPLEKLYLYGLVGVPGFILGGLYIIYSYYQGKRSQDGINHEAHLYGAIYGIIFALVVYPPAASAFIDQIMQYRIF